MEIKRLNINQYRDYKEKDLQTRINLMADVYKNFGWDGESQINPTKVFLSEEDSVELLEIMTNDNKDPESMGIKLLWLNKGASTDRKLKKGKVRLLKGWMK